MGRTGRCIALAAVVAVIHAGIIFTLRGAKRSEIAPTTNIASSGVVLLTLPKRASGSTATTQSPPAPPPPIPKLRQPSIASRPVLADVANPAQSDSSTLSPNLFPQEKFYLVDDLTDTASAPDTFGATLERTLPLNLGEIELELWISAEGKVVQVDCISDTCTPAINTDIQQLLTLVFRPALIGEKPVASRKRIFAEQTSPYGF